MNALEESLYTKLTGCDSLTAKLASDTAVYNLLIPQGQALPAVVFSYHAGGEENLTPTRSKNYVYLIKAISEVSLKEAGEIDDLLTTCLHNQALSVSGWGNFWLMREGDVRYVEVGEGGELYYHAGGFFRIRLAEE